MLGLDEGVVELSLFLESLRENRLHRRRGAEAVPGSGPRGLLLEVTLDHGGDRGGIFLELVEDRLDLGTLVAHHRHQEVLDADFRMSEFSGNFPGHFNYGAGIG